jgi:ABC-type transporter Mla subunit MlaD
MLCGILLCAGAWAQTRHDPLTPREVDQLRETAQLPKKRIDLLISFARERMLAIDRLRSATKSNPDDTGKIADLLADLATVIDELDDNLEMYNRHSEDLRSPLRHVLDAEAEFQSKLESLNQSATPLQKRRLTVALEDALDSVKASSETSRAMLAAQIEKKGEEKDKDKLDRHEAKETTDTHAGRE